VTDYGSRGCCSGREEGNVLVIWESWRKSGQSEQLKGEKQRGSTETETIGVSCEKGCLKIEEWE
jgi:hypothetical protein